MSDKPYMPLYIGDYFGDTKHLSCEQHGAYLQLLMAMWRHGGYLRNDDEKLSRIVGLRPARWRLIAPDLMPLFVIDGDRITQKRLRKEIEKGRGDPKQPASNREHYETRGHRNGGHRRHKPLKNNDPFLPIPLPEVSPNGDTPSVEGSPPPRRCKRHPTEIEPGWKPSADTLGKLIGEGFSHHQLEAGRETMIDWAQSNGKTKRDWDATFRNWVREDARRANGAGSRSPPRVRSRPQRKTAFDAAMEQIYDARAEDEHDRDRSKTVAPISH